MNKVSRVKSNRITLQKYIWCKIRYYQQLNDISDSDLASSLDVTERTLKEYDKSANNVTLAKVDRFLYVNNMKISDLLNM